jgi:hypothetical protein
MPNPTRRCGVLLGAERCTHSVWCSENWPALSGIADALASSSGSVMVWPVRLMLLASFFGTCRICRGLPCADSTSMQPASWLASVSATHAVTCS